MKREGAFTLVELVLVMALLCVILAVAAPSLSRSMHGRNLKQEATRVLALTEYARDEAASQGVPMVVWIDPGAGRFGVKIKPGFEDEADARDKEFTLTDGLRFNGIDDRRPEEGRPMRRSLRRMALWTPSSETSISLVDQSNSSITISQTSDACGYEIVDDQIKKALPPQNALVGAFTLAEVLAALAFSRSLCRRLSKAFIATGPRC